MTGSLTTVSFEVGGGGNVPGIPGARTTRNFTYLVRGQSIKNGLALDVWYHQPVTTASRFWAGAILHWAAYNRHWCLDIIFMEET